MSWGTKEQKGDLLKLGLESGLELFKQWTEENQRINEKAKEDQKIDSEELNQILAINEEYTQKINNLLFDTDLGCEFKKTESFFLEIVEIIMLDLEDDYKELIQAFTKAIDNKEFIHDYEEAKKQRDIRLQKEYEKQLEVYQKELEIYNEKLEAQNKKGFFSRLMADEIEEPVKPELRK